mmetsp:Transcript_65236/g.180956  ORF Transcript_65236/g.180956 Transcript_65236/m.180956 type:complete len:224 (-) Transcript_65236:1170-1841(-)
MCSHGVYHFRRGVRRQRYLRLRTSPGPPRGQARRQRRRGHCHLRRENGTLVGTHEVHEAVEAREDLRNLLHGPLGLVHEHVDVDAPRATSEPQTARDKLLQVDRAGFIVIQQPEQIPGIVDSYLQTVKICLYMAVTERLLKGAGGDAPGVGRIHALEQFLQLLRVHLLDGHLGLYHHILVVISALDGRLAKCACDNVQNGKVGEGYKNNEHHLPQRVDDAQRR